MGCNWAFKSPSYFLPVPKRRGELSGLRLQAIRVDTSELTGRASHGLRTGDFNAPGLGLLRFGNPHRQDTRLHFRTDVIGFDLIT